MNQHEAITNLIEFARARDGDSDPQVKLSIRILERRAARLSARASTLHAAWTKAIATPKRCKR